MNVELSGKFTHQYWPDTPAYGKIKGKQCGLSPSWQSVLSNWVVLDHCIYSLLVALFNMNVSNPPLKTYITGASQTACWQVMCVLCEMVLWFKPSAWSSNCMTLVVILYSSVLQRTWFYQSPPHPPSAVSDLCWNAVVWKTVTMPLPLLVFEVLHT